MIDVIEGPLSHFFRGHYDFILLSPDRGFSGAACQQPGSPGCPQQLCRFRTLIKLLRKTRYSFRCQGIGADMLVKKAL
jgi:hypothetical protein